MKTIILILTSAFMLFSCNSDEDNFTIQNINPVLIGKGNDNNNVPPQNSKITNSAEWNALLSSFGSSITSTFTETNIDFNTFDVIVTVDEIRQDSGHSRTITSIVENQNDIVAVIVNEYAGTGYTVLTRPYHIVKIPKSSKPIVFQ
ncbi:MAG: hypothetical protein QM564_13600 [Bergeyella sp.]